MIIIITTQCQLQRCELKTFLCYILLGHWSYIYTFQFLIYSIYTLGKTLTIVHIRKENYGFFATVDPLSWYNFCHLYIVLHGQRRIVPAKRSTRFGGSKPLVISVQYTCICKYLSICMYGLVQGVLKREYSCTYA